jgi:hypothetical protein
MTSDLTSEQRQSARSCRSTGSSNNVGSSNSDHATSQSRYRSPKDSKSKRPRVTKSARSGHTSIRQVELADDCRFSHDETPLLEEQDWPGLWSRMLHSDLDTDVILDDSPATEDGLTASLLAVGDDIETWAKAHWGASLSSANSISGKDENAVQDVVQSGGTADVRPLCFGMVRSSAEHGNRHNEYRSQDLVQADLFHRYTPSVSDLLATCPSSKRCSNLTL